MPVWKDYVKEMSKEFGMLATWTPGEILSLGDVGYVREGRFVQQTTLAALGIAFRVVPGARDVEISYKSKGSISIAFKGAGKSPGAGSLLPEAQAGVTIGFSKSHAIVFEALECKTDTITDVAALGALVKQAWFDGKWERDFVVVTDLKSAASCAVMIATNSSSKVELTASGAVATASFSLADTTIGLSIVAETGLETKLLAKNGATPLYGARSLRAKGEIAPLYRSIGLSGMDMVRKGEPGAKDAVHFDTFNVEDLMRTSSSVE